MTRVLFVDDEPKVLEGLRRMLRAYRNEWTMQFCEGPEAALEAMKERVFDVVVTDMRMPVMDGAELLTRIRDKYPETVRIVLSGHSEQERILRAVGPAHQYLSKPCDPESLYTTIMRACSLSRRVNNPKLKTLVSQMDSLPSLPDIYFQLVEELKDENASVDQIGDLIARDISMTAKVLQLVNSSFFGLPVHVNDAKHAAALLGLNTLKPLVLTASVFRQLEESRVSESFLDKVFGHSMEVGGVAKKLAHSEQLDQNAIDNAFIAGALHDVGKVVMADNFGRDYTVLSHKAKAQNASVTELEIEQFGTSHADVGGFLLGLWGLPQEITEAVAFHHDPAASVDERFSLLTAVHVSNCFTGRDALPDEQAEAIDLVDDVYLDRLQLAGQLPIWQGISEECAELV